MNLDRTGQPDPSRHLEQRAKELSCLYELEEILNRPLSSIDDVCAEIVRILPSALQHTDICMVQLRLDGASYASPNFLETAWKLNADISVQGSLAGNIAVFYSEETPQSDDGPFLNEEVKLLATIADHLGYFVGQRRIQQIIEDFQTSKQEARENKPGVWRTVLSLLRRTDKGLFFRLSQKMLYQLSWKGVSEAQTLLRESFPEVTRSEEEGPFDNGNKPANKNGLALSDVLSRQVFDIAVDHFGEDQVLTSIQKWLQEDSLNFVVDVATQNTTLTDVKYAIRRYSQLASDGVELTAASKRVVQVSLIRRFLSDQVDFVNTAKRIVAIEDFDSALSHTISTPDSRGALGGKAAGLFLAWQVLRKAELTRGDSYTIEVPETWYIPSDVLLTFLRLNNLSDIVEQKYKDIDQVRLEYPRIVQALKNCSFPQEIVQGLARVLDAFENSPIIVRSSSLLEDRVGAVFSGKYKSLFLANQGSKRQRLEALTDAIAEVYASTFGPDPIEYRAERGLLDLQEEMGILIQKVIGSKIGDYFLPAFAGVAFSRNDFRWSPRIRREDGLVRMVPGLGTRAVDRLSDDYPVLISPGQPGIRVNVTVDEIVRYSPKRVDVINMRSNTFETIRVDDLLRRSGWDIPYVTKVVSAVADDQIRKPMGLTTDFDTDTLVVTFDGMFTDTPFLKQIHEILQLLERELGTPVDMEFAFDGDRIYLLQCRPQSHCGETAPAVIPTDVPKDRIVFSANRYVSNGCIQNLTHLVYVDPDRYAELVDETTMATVGRAVGKLNQLLPKRQFALMGPGRWGSRGDIRLGVSVTYSDISNAALLVEIARKKGDYVPDLSFGTHFFQDLVESRIRYLPLYPDDENVIFNHFLLENSPNLLAAVAPEFSALAETVKLIEIPKVASGLVLNVLMNGDRDEAVGILADKSVEQNAVSLESRADTPFTQDYSSWRLEMAKAIAAEVDAERFGVHAMYVLGSTKTGTAGPCSDIDLLVHFRGTAAQEGALALWLDGWSRCLDEMNYLRTGKKASGLLDTHIVTDDDIRNRTHYAVKIGAATDAARPLRLGRHPT